MSATTPAARAPQAGEVVNATAPSTADEIGFICSLNPTQLQQAVNSNG